MPELTDETKCYALLGVAGFVAPRHLKAIADTNGQLLAACDPNDSVGVIDSYFPDAAFFTEFERFDRYLEKLRREGDGGIDLMSICSPNYLHDAHARLGLRLGADVICEKPLVLNPWNLDQLESLENEFGKRVYTVLQLRYLPSLIAKQDEILRSGKRHQVDMSYITRRGRWYARSWKGQVEKSGGLSTNLGIHLFDLLQWLFGKPQEIKVSERETDHERGTIIFERADVNWFLSTNAAYLPRSVKDAGGYAHRSLTVDGKELEFSTGFSDLHTAVYQAISEGKGLGIQDARPSIELAYAIRTTSAE